MRRHRLRFSSERVPADLNDATTEVQRTSHITRHCGNFGREHVQRWRRKHISYSSLKNKRREWQKSKSNFPTFSKLVFRKISPEQSVNFRKPPVLRHKFLERMNCIPLPNVASICSRFALVSKAQSAGVWVPGPFSRANGAAYGLWDLKRSRCRQAQRLQDEWQAIRKLCTAQTGSGIPTGPSHREQTIYQQTKRREKLSRWGQGRV